MTVVVFWTSVIVVAYTYVGYAVLVAALARIRKSVIAQPGPLSPVTVVIAAYNEAQRIAQRVDDILRQDYPAENLTVIVVSDGSDDGTEQAAACSDARVRILALPRNLGKASALNIAMTAVATEFVVFSDARQRFASDTLRRLVAPFGDAASAPSVANWKLSSALPIDRDLRRPVCTGAWRNGCVNPRRASAGCMA